MAMIITRNTLPLSSPRGSGTSLESALPLSGRMVLFNGQDRSGDLDQAHRCACFRPGCSPLLPGKPQTQSIASRSARAATLEAARPLFAGVISL
ncbi:MAG: hypothetical protein HQL99_10515 [Magnetococcales bacterium]|nr:hypothetical protein [Magnetococcales bacterium]